MKLKEKRSLKVLNRLKAQLKGGVKPVTQKKMSTKGTSHICDLTDKDIFRIKSEINILETKLKHLI